MTPITLTINGETVTTHVEPRLSLADLLREQQRLTGTHLGCEHGVCGACTVLIDGEPVRSCITLAASCDGVEVRSVEGFENDPKMDVIRRSFHEKHGLQCGFCTPGMLVSVYDLLSRKPGLSEQEIRVQMSGNICRCTGYQGIVRSIRHADEQLNGTKQKDAAE